MKNILILILIALAVRAGAQSGYVISNFDATVDNQWTNVVQKLNYNNGQSVAWLNALNASNSVATGRITNLNAEVTALQTNIGVYCPTNTWNLQAATNGLHNGDWRANLNSNGFLLDVYWSNNAAVFLTHH